MTSKFALVIANTEYQDASFAKLTAPGKDFGNYLSHRSLAKAHRSRQLNDRSDIQQAL